MSSILTALKKLESNDSREKELLILSRRSLSGRKIPFLNFSSPSGFVLKTLLVASLLLFSFAMLSRFRGQMDPEKTTPSEMAKLGKAGIAEKRPVEDNLSKTVDPAKTIDPGLIRAGEANPVMVEKELLPSGEKGFKKPEFQARKPAELDLKNTGKAEDVEEKEINPSQIGYPGWSLQAIAWAPDPKMRIAVINGSVLKEGDAFDGAFISKIDENEVVLNKDANVLRLIFKLR